MQNSRALAHKLSIFAVGVLALASAVVPATPAAAAATGVEGACATVEAVFARGSGQGVGEGEAQRFFSQLSSRVASPLTVNPYELGSQNVDGFQYPAVKVDGWEFGTGVDAKISSGGAFRYGKSVNSGVDELDRYIAKRIAKCGASTRFILGGYSQGAQVIGETYVEKLSNAERDAVVFNVLLGDPKLYLPEGERPLFGTAPACTGKYTKSEWRRDVPVCETDNGSLGARKPYLPAAFISSTGLWCADADFVCGSRKFFWDNEGHGTYKNEGAGIDKGVREGVDRLRAVVPAESADHLDVTFYPVRSGTTGLDVAFVIDSTGSMGGQIDAAKGIASALASFVQANRGRVALIEYRDAGDTFTARVLSPLTDGTADFTSQLESIEVDGGGDTPEALMHALTTTFNGLTWRPGATKAAIVLTDADYHDPDLVDGSTLASVAKRSLEIDPVNVYPVVSAYMADYYKPLAEATSGKVIADSGDTTAALESALSVIEERPVPTLEFNRYSGPVGSTIRFDATGSYSVSSEIVKWDWDWDGDGTYDREGGESIEEHRYDAAFDGLVQLRVTDKNGLVANYSVPVEIGGEPSVGPLPADSVAVVGEGTEATVSWTAETAPSGAWGITVNGVPVGSVASERRTIAITDVDRSESVEFGVTPISTEGEVGTSRVVYLDPPRTEPTPTPTPTPTPAPTTSDDPSNAGPSLTLSVTDVERGSSLTVHGVGFAPGTTAQIWLHSTPVLLTSTDVSSTGAFSREVEIPAMTSPGPHAIVVSTPKGDVSVALTVRASTAAGLSSTGSTFSPWVLAAGVGALIIGAGILIWRRRRA